MEDAYFLDRGFKKLGQDIYLYKNFLNSIQINNLIKVFDNVKENSLFQTYLIGTTFENKVSVQIKELKPVLSSLKSLIGSSFSLHDNISINVMRKGDFWGQHSDNHDFIEKRKLSLSLNKEDPYQIVQDNKYGIVIYFNEVEEGGELYYSNQDITYVPKPGDMVIHSAEEHCMHGVNEIISGYRYSYSNFLSSDLKVPIN
jgi:hypothetical protein